MSERMDVTDRLWTPRDSESRRASSAISLFQRAGRDTPKRSWQLRDSLDHHIPRFVPGK